MVDRLAPSTRHKFDHSGRVIYEWDQTLTEVNLYIEVPHGVKAKQLAVEISSKHLTVAIKGNPPYLDHDFAGSVKAADSYWTVEDGLLSIQLTKSVTGGHWEAALAGHQVDVVAQQEDRKRLMLQRFQQEHPGFDFSGADFNGEVPDPSKYLGGVSST